VRLLSGATIIGWVANVIVPAIADADWLRVGVSFSDG
jgi:hypothetical protein